MNEKPSLLYKTRDELLSPHYKACYAALIAGQGKPDGMDKAIWDDCRSIKATADSKREKVHYARGKGEWVMLEEGPDGTPKLPKVPLTDDWLVFKNYEDYEKEPAKDTFRNCLCTPYMYCKYGCIFGLTGSVGGDAERAYIKKTYEAVAYEVPQFLHTCDATTKEEAKNLGVSITRTNEELIEKVVEAARQHYADKPVLIITRGAEDDELIRVYKRLMEVLADDPAERMGMRERVKTPKMQRKSSAPLPTLARSPGCSMR